MERDTLRLFAKCCRKAKQSENRWPRLSRTRFHRSHHTSLPFISVYSAIAARAYYTPRLASLYFSYALYSLFVLLNARDQSFPFFFCIHVLFLTAEVPPSRSPSAHRIYSDFLTCSTLSILSHRQFHRVPSSLYLSRTCSVFAPLRFRHFPRRSFVTTLLSLLILIDTTSRACLSPPTELAVFFYSALSARMHHVRPSLCLEPRYRPSLRPAAFISFR